MNTYIILIPPGLSGLDARVLCETIESHVFGVSNESSHCENQVREMVCDFLDIDKSVEGIEVERLTDFMNRVNDELFRADDYFMSYVHLHSEKGGA